MAKELRYTPVGSGSMKITSSANENFLRAVAVIHRDNILLNDKVLIWSDGEEEQKAPLADGSFYTIKRIKVKPPV